MDSVLQPDTPPLKKQLAHTHKRRRKQKEPTVEAQISAPAVLTPPEVMPEQKGQHDQQAADRRPHALGKAILADKYSETPQYIQQFADSLHP